jgi:drug/metabolite transporter (DMT)-like permease
MIASVWVLVTLVAAGFQTARTAQQHRLRSVMSVSGAGFVRYVYGAPIALAAVAVAVIAGADLPTIPARFWPTIAIGGIGQILGTICLIKAFDARDFAIGTVYTKTEVVQVALLSTAIGEPLRLAGWLGVAVCMVGVALLATHGDLRRLGSVVTRLGEPAAAFGVLAGGLFAIASIGIREASGSLGDGRPVLRAIVTLAAMNTIQTVVHGGYLLWRDRAQITLAWTHRRSSSIVGVLSVAGSAGWALALTLENAARVRTVGQIELLFTFAVSRWVLHEERTRNELVASALVLVGILTVMLVG